jgi:hypothetical protein
MRSTLLISRSQRMSPITLSASDLMRLETFLRLRWRVDEIFSHRIIHLWAARIAQFLPLVIQGTMRVLRTIILLALTALSFRFLVAFGREVYPLWRIVGSWTFFLNQPYVGTEQYSGEVNRNLSLLLVADGAEGSHIVYYFPSWPLALAAAVVLLYAFLTVFALSGDRAAPIDPASSGFVRPSGEIWVRFPSALTPTPLPSDGRGEKNDGDV